MKKLETQICLYAIVKSLYEQGEDYIDTFRPFVIKVFPEIGKPVKLSFIQSSLKEDFRLRIPQHTLETILKRMKRKDYIRQEGKQYMLTLEGQNYFDSLEIDLEVDRRLNELLDDLKNFLNEQLGTSLNTDQIMDILLSFVHKNFELMTECFISPPISNEMTTLGPTTPEKKSA